jgi:hypothetical protein
VIDAHDEVVGRRSVWGRVKMALATVFVVALVGFAIPQIWLVAQRVGEFIAVP